MHQQPHQQYQQQQYQHQQMQLRSASASSASASASTSSSNNINAAFAAMAAPTARAVGGGAMPPSASRTIKNVGSKSTMSDPFAALFKK
jgi:hypothetical protein